MKKLILILAPLLFALLLFACEKEQTGHIPLGSLPENYSLDDAKKAGVIIHENGDITYGQKIWDEFLRETEKGNAASVRIGNYYTLRDKSHYDEQYYEQIKNDYPKFYVFDLFYDGEKYTVTEYEDGKEITASFKYLRKFEGDAESPTATFSSYTRYALTNDSTVTWERLTYGLYSSRLGDLIPFRSVYNDLVMKE